MSVTIAQKLWILPIIFLYTAIAGNVNAQQNHEQKKVDFTVTTIVVSKQSKETLSTAIEVLQEEVLKRTGILWKQSNRLSKNTVCQVIISLENDPISMPLEWQTAVSDLNITNPDGYKLLVLFDGKTVIISAKTPRGALYGIGKLLRTMEMRQGNVLIPSPIQIASDPAYPIRGHQLGYRPKTNSYDAWTVAQFDQYIRELALFGANSIEIIPPGTDDDATSLHMKLPHLDMLAEQSRICQKYDLDVWMWYPNMGSDYVHPDSVEKELAIRREVFAKVPRLDHLFVPGGDPGELEPDVLFNWLEKEAMVLNQYHPDAKIWVSPQVFRPTKAWLDKFFYYINQKPNWLGGVVFGPWVKMSIEEIRSVTNPDIPIRRYPDITHSYSCQYPVPRWDLAYAITLGRECINPRPDDEKHYHNVFARYAQGSISYSEGTNDDVNKFIWSDQDWNPETPVIETLRDYARFFIGPDYTEDVAQGLLALEQNFDGPLAINTDVGTALLQWQDMEKKASEEVLGNYRFQMGLIRAYFDFYIQKRLIYETWLEQKGKEWLSLHEKIGPDSAISACKTTLMKAWLEPVDQQLKHRCVELADQLFESIGAQLTIEKHGAAGGRGNFIDNIDVPLNDVAWIFSELDKAEKASTTHEKSAIIEAILNRTNPGPGGFYDNFGNPDSWKRVIFRTDPLLDPGSLKTPRVNFGVGLKDVEWVDEIKAVGFEGRATPMAWMNCVNTLYDQPLEIEYNNLEPNSRYLIRVAYTGRFRSRMKLTVDGITVHELMQTGEQPVYEFPIPSEAIKDGKVTFSWTCGEAERGSQVSEVWIIRLSP